MGFSKADTDAMLARIRERSGRTSSLLGSVVNVRAKGSTKRRDRGMNETEKRYASYLEALQQRGEVAWYAFEPMKLRLTDTSTLTPDFMVMLPSGLIEFHDTKGYWKRLGKPGITDDALEKLKQAAETYWMFPVKAVWEVDGNWQERVF